WCPQEGHGTYPSPDPVLVWRNAASITRPRKNIPRPRLPTAAEKAEEQRQNALAHDLHWLELFETNPNYMRMMVKRNQRMLTPSSETSIPNWFLTKPVRTDEQFDELCVHARTVRNDLKRRLRVPTYAEEFYVPRPCRLFPERVTE